MHRILDPATRILAAIMLLLMLVPAIRALRDEDLVRRMRVVASAAPPAAATALASEPDTEASHLPARARLFRALARSRAAYASADPVRRAQWIAGAETDLAQAFAARPVWAEAEVASAYLAFVKTNAGSPGARAAFERSYRAARFLDESADWRLRYGVNQWEVLPQATRHAVIAEAIAVAERSSGRLAMVEAIMDGGVPGDCWRRARALYHHVNIRPCAALSRPPL